MDVITPNGLNYRDYQKEGILGIFKRNCTLLADEAGLGKTIQTCGAINQFSAFDSLKVLIVCPTSLKFVWRDEIEKWVVAERSVTQYFGKSTKVEHFQESLSNVEFGSLNRVDFHVIGYNIAIRKEVKKQLIAEKFDMVIFDEAHALRNPTSKQTKVCLGFNNTKPLIHGVSYVVAITGTPIANRPKDIFPLVSRLDPSTFGTEFHDFGVEFCNAYQGAWGWNYDGKSNLKKLNQLLRFNIMIRRKKSEVLKDLPDKAIIPVLIDPYDAEGLRDLGIDAKGIKALREYLDAEQEILKGIYKEKYGDSWEKKWNRTIKITNGKTKEGVSPFPFDEVFDDVEKLELAMQPIATKRRELGDIKAPIVGDFVAGLLDGGEEKVVVFAHHTSVVNSLQEKLKKYGVVKIVGSMTSTQRECAVKSFQGDENTRVIILNMVAGGTGLTLTKASRVVFAELDWTPSVIEQAIDRCHRYGQTRKVVAQLVVLKNSLEAHIAKMVDDKARGISVAIDGV